MKNILCGSFLLSAGIELIIRAMRRDWITVLWIVIAMLWCVSWRMAEGSALTRKGGKVAHDQIAKRWKGWRASE